MKDKKVKQVLSVHWYQWEAGRHSEGGRANNGEIKEKFGGGESK
jgi:hypothetical protein